MQHLAAAVPLLCVVSTSASASPACPEHYTSTDTFSAEGSSWVACEDLSKPGGSIVLVPDGSAKSVFLPKTSVTRASPALAPAVRNLRRETDRWRDNGGPFGVGIAPALLRRCSVVLSAPRGVQRHTRRCTHGGCAARTARSNDAEPYCAVACMLFAVSPRPHTSRVGGSPRVSIPPSVPSA